MRRSADGDLTDRQIHGFAGMQAANYMWASVYAQYRPEVFDDRLTRGGPVVRRAASWGVYPSFSTDDRKRLVASIDPGYGRNAEGAASYHINTSLRYRPAPNLTLSLGPSYSHSESSAQFVRSFDDPTASAFFGQRTVFADLAQRTLSMDTRVEATFTPDLTLELFLQPFVSAGEYHGFKEFVRPRALDKHVFGDTELAPIVDPNGRTTGYALDSDSDPATAPLTWANPDFSFRSLRGNAVLRWEYRPGSTVFLVWQQQRAADSSSGDFRFGRDTRGIFDGAPDNIFLVKLSYWLGR